MTGRLVASLLVLAVWLSGCGVIAKKPAEPVSSADGTQREVERLRDQVRTLEEQLRQCRQQVNQYKDKSVEDSRQIEFLSAELKQAMTNPGYEIVFRLVYARLQEGDRTLLASLLPTDSPVEAGMRLKQHQTYRPYGRAADINLQPFVDYARQHPLSSAQVSVATQRAGYAVASASFADGTVFGLFFTGKMITKIEVSDKSNPGNE